MAGELRVTLEIGPAGKRVVAIAPDWPGLERGAKTAEAAVDWLQSYLPATRQWRNSRGWRQRLPPSPLLMWSSGFRAQLQPISGASPSRSQASIGKTCRVKNWNVSST